MIERDFLFAGCNHNLKVFYFQLILEVKYFFEMIELTVRIRIYRRHLILLNIFQMWIRSTQSMERQLCVVHISLRTLQNNLNLAFFGQINFNWVHLLFFHHKNNSYCPLVKCTASVYIHFMVDLEVVDVHVMQNHSYS